MPLVKPDEIIDRDMKSPANDGKAREEIIDKEFGRINSSIEALE